MNFSDCRFYVLSVWVRVGPWLTFAFVMDLLERSG